MKTPSSLVLTLLSLGTLLLPAAPTDTLVGYWKMEGTNGPAVVDSASGGTVTDDGTWVGSPAYTTGVFGEAGNLSGSNYLSVPDSVDTDRAGQDLSLSGWFTVATWDTGWQALMAKGEGSNFRVARRSGSSTELSYAGGTGDIFGGSVNDGQWHHVVAVTDHGSQTRLYIDGVRVATGGSPSISDENQSFLIGANPNANGRQWKGLIDDVGMFDDAFDDAIVASLYALAVDSAYRYDLGTFNQLLVHYRCGPGAALQLGPISWSYAASNPNDGRDFFAMNADGSGLVATEAAILSLTASPEFIFTGGNSTLTWDTVGFTSLTLDDGLNPPLNVTGQTQAVVSPGATTTYTLTGTGPTGSDSAQVTVNVNAPPTVTLTSSDLFVPAGASVDLQWTSSGATALSIDQGVGNVFPDTDPDGSGSRTVTVPATRTYTITASNPAGSSQAQVTVTTGVAPVINSFTLAEPNPVPGEVVELSWNVSNADSVEISPSVGSVDPVSGTACDYPAVTTTYTLTATNGFSQSTAMVTAALPQPIGIDGSLWTVLHRTSTGTIDSLAAADALLAGSGVADSQTVNGVAEINYGPAGGNAGEFPNDVEPPLGDALDDFVVRATATLVVNFPGTYTFGINNDDGGRLRIDGNDVIVDDALHGPQTTNGTANLSGGVHTIEYLYFERGGGQAGEVFYVDPDGVNSQLVLTGTAANIVTPDLIINEFMADNDRTLDDFEGNSSDWIELYNGTNTSINLSGYYLTDDITIPNKWALPAYVLPAGGYLVVFASGKDTTFPGDEFHTNFALNNNGEYLGLYKGFGAGPFTVVTDFFPAFPPQEEDISYGSWGNRQLTGYMPNPTPGSLNFGGVDGFVGDTSFDVDRGFFTVPFDLTITTTEPGATIRYTLDGSLPTQNHGEIYNGPIPISETTVVRAAGFLKGYLPTNVDTQTYLFLDDVPLQDQAHAVALGFPAGSVNGQRYEYGMTGGSVSDAQVIDALQRIPTISLVMEQEDFSSSATGIYSNAGNRGRGWERECSVELINESGLGAGQFQMNAGVRIRGGFSRSNNNPKHAFRLFFRNDYEGDLNYPVFQDEGPSSFENLDLRTSQNYSWAFQNDSRNTFLREIHGRDAQREMEQPYTRSRYYHLYINGVYWGLYMSQERSEASYGETYFGGDEDDYDVIKSAGSSGGYRTEATDGNFDAWQDLWNKVRAVRANPTDDAAYFALQGLAPDGVSPHPDPANNPNLLEVDNMIDYLLAIFHTGNFDAPLSTFIQASNNWYGMRNRNGTEGFRFFVYDGEHALGTGSNSNNRVGPWGDQYTGRPPSDFSRSNPQYMHEDLAWNEEYRMDFADRVHKHFFNSGVLAEPASLARMDARSVEIEDAVRAELARWGGGFNYNTWLNARQDIVNFLNKGSDGSGTGPGRAAYLINIFRNYNHGGSKPLYPPIDAPVFSQNGGTVPDGFPLGITNPNGSGTVYYTIDGSDPRLAGGAVNPSAAISGGSVTLLESGPVRSRVLSGGTWSAMNEFDFIVGVASSADNLVVSELHYNPIGTVADSFPDKDDYEFIELLNLSESETIELTGVRFTNGITFDFSGSAVTQLSPGGRVVVVRNLVAFQERYPAVPVSVVAGEYIGNLENRGERITLLDSTDAVIKDFIYDDAVPWPTAPDGEGYSLVLNCDVGNPDHNHYASWRSHGTVHGNPGGPDGLAWDDFVAANGLTGASGADADLDGSPDYFEYIYGTDPNDPADSTAPTVSLETLFVDGVFRDFATLTFQRSLTAGDPLIFPEVSTDLLTWSDTESDLEMVSALNQGDGTELVQWRATLPVGEAGKTRCFLRLRIEGK